jgi:hypothetical protein
MIAVGLKGLQDDTLWERVKYVFIAPAREPFLSIPSRPVEP